MSKMYSVCNDQGAGTSEYDMIKGKGNESDVGNIDFEILAKSVFKFFYLILFLAITNCI